MAIYLLLQADAPKRCRTPFVALSHTADIIVVEPYTHDLRAHVVQQEVGIGMDRLPAQPRQTSAIQQDGTTWARMQGRHVAQVAFRLVKFPLAKNDLRIVDITPGGNPQALHIEIHILHVLGRDVKLVISQSHHTSLAYLCLPLANLLRITAVGHAHVAREAQLNSQVKMLRLVAR